MAKYSRTQKYEELRNHMTSDAEAELRSKNLASFQERLNQLDSRNFQAPETKALNENSERMHERAAFAQPVVEEPSFQRPAPVNSSVSREPEFSNDVLSDYINEVKKYNIDSGTALDTDTSVNILRSLHRDPEPVPSKPYPDEEPVRSAGEFDLKQKTKELRSVQDAPSDTGTVTSILNDLPFYTGQHEDFLPAEDKVEGTQSMSKEDIEAEVQRLINGGITASTPVAEQDEKPVLKSSQTMNERQQILHETTQMRAQLDDYGDNLTEVNDRVHHTNQVLNVVLIVLIIALVIVLGVVVMMVLQAKGIL